MPTSMAGHLPAAPPRQIYSADFGGVEFGRLANGSPLTARIAQAEKKAADIIARAHHRHEGQCSASLALTIFLFYKSISVSCN